MNKYFKLYILYLFFHKYTSVWCSMIELENLYCTIAHLQVPINSFLTQNVAQNKNTPLEASVGFLFRLNNIYNFFHILQMKSLVYFREFNVELNSKPSVLFKAILSNVTFVTPISLRLPNISLRIEFKSLFFFILNFKFPFKINIWSHLLNYIYNQFVNHRCAV